MLSRKALAFLLTLILAAVAGPSPGQELDLGPGDQVTYNFAYSAEPTGASFFNNGQCAPDRPPLPCVLPINANVSFSDLGAGTRSDVSVDLDVYPGPKCMRQGGSSYLKDWTCDEASEATVYHDPLEHAIVHDELYMTLIRIILPEGFNASSISLDGGDGRYGRIEISNVTNTTTTRIDRNTSGVETFQTTSTGPLRVPVRVLARPLELSYGISEPSPSLVPIEIEGYSNYPVAEYRTGTNWAQRDPISSDGSVDLSRVVDLVTTSPIEPAENPFPAPYTRVTPRIYNSTQRVSFTLNGVLNRRELGKIESAMATGRRVFGVQLYKLLTSDVDRAVAGTSVFPPGAALLRYYNTRVRDPCAGSGVRGVNASADSPLKNCPESYDPERDPRLRMEWFDATDTTLVEILCPAGTELVNRSNVSFAPGTSVSCSNCPAGTFSNVTMALKCTPCPPGLFSDPATALFPGLGASGCTGCGPGRFATPGSLECSECAPGTYSARGGAGCIDCPQGYFAANGSNPACTKCPAGTSTLESRSSSQDECLAICMPGTYGIGGLEPCTPCASGTAASVPGALECLPCPAGHAPDAAATDCIPCAPGSFAAAAGTPACHVCPLHTFSATLGATSCEVCPVDAAKVATATQAGEALDSTPTLRTIAPGRTSAAECFVPCSPGEFSPQDGISSTESPCTPCQPGYYSPDFLSVECLPCMAGTYQDKASSVGCKVCPDGQASALSAASFCGMCMPGTFATSGPDGTVTCIQCPNGTHAPGPGASHCVECPEGTYVSQDRDACVRCPAGSWTVARRASSQEDCVLFATLGVLAHWELHPDYVDLGSSYTREPLDVEWCRETGAAFAVSPSDIVDLAGGIGPATLRGPLCAQGSLWDSSRVRGVGVGAVLATTLGAFTGLLSDGPLSSGLAVGEVDALVQAELLPTEAIGVEAWFSVGASDATRSGVVGAFQQGEDYGKGWALMHWRDRNRGDVWFVSFFVAVEANDAAFADFSSWRSDPNSRGGLASVVARVTPAPALDSWVHVAVDYDSAVSIVRIFVNGKMLASQAPCRGSCGRIQYPSVSDYWAAARPSLFSIGRVDNPAVYPDYLTPTGRASAAPLVNDCALLQASEGEISHRGMVGMVRIYPRRLADGEALSRYMLRAEHYSSAPGLQPWWWAASSAPGLLSPSLRSARSDANTPVDTEPGVVVGADGNVLSLADAEVGDTLQCELPDWRYGATARASAPPVLAVVSDTLGVLWQRVCTSMSCGFDSDVSGDALGDPWWVRAGLGALSGAHVSFNFTVDECGPGCPFPLLGAAMTAPVAAWASATHHTLTRDYDLHADLFFTISFMLFPP